MGVGKIDSNERTKIREITFQQVIDISFNQLTSPEAGQQYGNFFNRIIHAFPYKDDGFIPGIALFDVPLRVRKAVLQSLMRVMVGKH